jgi:hypothetical protein
MLPLSRTFALALTLTAALFQVPAMAAQPYVAIEKRLTQEQMHAAGLDTLSPEQLATLNRLLSDEQAARTRDQAQDGVGLREKRVEAEPVSATAKGDARGWSKGDVVELDNGQRWRVVEGELYLGKATGSRKVTIAPGAFGAWYMQVDGQTPRLKVQRVQ